MKPTGHKLSILCYNNYLEASWIGSEEMTSSRVTWEDFEVEDPEELDKDLCDMNIASCQFDPCFPWLKRTARVGIRSWVQLAMNDLVQKKEMAISLKWHWRDPHYEASLDPSCISNLPFLVKVNEKEVSHQFYRALEKKKDYLVLSTLQDWSD